MLSASADSLVRFTDEFFRSQYPPPPAPPIEDPRTTIVNDRCTSILSQDYDALLEQQLEETQKRVTPHPLNQEKARMSKAAINIGSSLNPWSILNKSVPLPLTVTSMQPPFSLTCDNTPRQQRQHNQPVTGPFQTPPASHGRSINQILPNVPYTLSSFSGLPSKPPLGQKAIESGLSHNDDESHFEPPHLPTVLQQSLLTRLRSFMVMADLKVSQATSLSLRSRMSSHRS